MKIKITSLQTWMPCGVTVPPRYSVRAEGGQRTAYPTFKNKTQPMKTHIKSLFTCLVGASRAARVLQALFAALGLILPGRVAAQTFTTLHSFSHDSDGATPFARLRLSGNTLYGTAANGGSANYGTLFAVNTDGTGFTNLYNFTRFSDGASPFGGVVLSGNTLYGPAVGGGSSDQGTVFTVNT